MDGTYWLEKCKKIHGSVTQKIEIGMSARSEIVGEIDFRAQFPGFDTINSEDKFLKSRISTISRTPKRIDKSTYLSSPSNPKRHRRQPLLTIPLLVQLDPTRLEHLDNRRRVFLQRRIPELEDGRVGLGYDVFDGVADVADVRVDDLVVGGAGAHGVD